MKKSKPRLAEEKNSLPTPVIETITPQMAEKLLELNTHNRSIRQGVVDRYAEAMRKGQWELNGESIKISETNILLDGQHRLWAIFESGCSIKTFVIRGLPDQVFDTIDTGATRHARDTLHLNGKANPTILSMAARLQLIHDNTGSIEAYGRGTSRLITNRDILELVERHPDLERSVSFISKSSQIRTFITPAVASYLHYQFCRCDSSQADLFMSKLSNGDGLAIDHPILIARNRLAAIKHGTDSGRIESAAVTIKAWNLFRNGKTAKIIRWPNVPGEAFPQIK